MQKTDLRALTDRLLRAIAAKAATRDHHQVIVIRLKRARTRARWTRVLVRRALTMLVVAFVVVADYAVAQETLSLEPTSVVDRFDGTIVADPASLPPLAASPDGVAVATQGSSGPQGVVSAAAAQAVTSAGRTAAQFSVTPTGAATYNIPLWTPPGAREIEPHLSLHYTSGGPDGSMGPGWSLTGVSAIARCGKTWASSGGAPSGVTLATTDDICLDGNRLRLVSGTQGVAGSTYQTELATFSVVTAYSAAGNGPASFTVQGKDGRYYDYGTTTDSRIFASGATTPYLWGISKIRDRQGNNMAFTYNTGTVLSLQKIQYTASPGTGFSAPYEVDFNYVPRTGGTALTKYVSGGAVTQANQLDNVTVLASGTIVRKYGLTYAASPTTNRPLLQSVQECGGGTGTDCLRPTTLTYQAGGAGWTTTPSSTGLTGQYGFTPIDLNGDGIPDALYGKQSGTNTHWYARIATTSGYGAELDTGLVASPTATIIPGAFAGNGKTQFLAVQGAVWYVYGFNGSAITSASTGLSTSGEQVAVDYDGDGLPDLVSISGSNVLVRRNITTAGGPVRFAATANAIWTTSGAVSFGGTGLFGAADFNGDGRGDLLVATIINTGFGTIVYWNALMSNGFGASATATQLLGTGTSYPMIGDWNADGCTDIVSTYKVFVSNCAGGFTAVSTSVPQYGDTAFVLDWDGDGQSDLIYADSGSWYVQRSTGSGIAAPVSLGVAAPASKGFFPSDQNSDGQPDLAYVDAAAGYAVSYLPHNGTYAPPDLVSSISDGFGITFSPSYTPISQGHYTPGSSAAFPDIDFQGPMYVVYRFVASDGTGGTYTDDFFYWGARLNLQGRGFEGFATTRQTDNRNGIYQVTNYRQDFPYIGAIFETDVYQPNLTTFMSKVVNTYSYANLQGVNCSLRCFPFTSGTTTSHYEVGGTKNGQLISADVASYTYDGYGTLTNTAITRTDYDFYAGQQWLTTIANTITNDATNYCIGRPSRTTTTKTAPGQSAQTRTVDHTIDYVQCRATAEIVEPTSSLLKVTTNFGFDACGNTTSVSVVGLDKNGAAMAARTTGTSYGTRCQFPETVTNPLNQTSSVAYNYALGVKSSATDANGIVLSWLYDNFGRKTKETRPDSTYTTWSYSDCVSTSCWGVPDLRFQTQEILYSSAGTLLRHHYTFYDGLDRLRFNEADRVLGVWVTPYTVYDALGRKTKEYLPYSASSNGYHGYSYDLANRPTSDTTYTPAGAVYRTLSMGYLGDTVTVTDPRSNTVTKVGDLTGKTRQVTDPAPGGTTAYTFDSFGNLVMVVDAIGATSTYAYNIRGVKTTSTDADTGSWTFTPDSLNELVSQTDAKGQTTTFTFDPLGRLTARVEPESSTATQFNYGTSSTAHNIGHLQSVTKPDGYAEVYGYDSFGRPLTTKYTEDGADYQFDFAYNINGTLDTLTYPTSTAGVRWILQYVYDSFGYLHKTQDSGTGAAFWVLTSANDSSLPTNELLGNGVQVVSGYTPQTNELISRTEGPGGNLTSLQNLSYTWDLAGNLQQRQDLRQNLTEAFVNDPLNRLTSSTLNGTTNLTVGYDAAGNIGSKSDVGTYTYGDAAHKHAVTRAGSWTMSYDANGNVISRAGGSISWYSFNLPNQINYNGSSSQFNYNAEHKRWKQIANYAGTTETTHYIGGMLEVMTRGTVTEYRHQIPAGSSNVVYTRRSDGTNSTYYATSDHLGSSDLVLDSSGAVLARESFTAFGARRGSNWQGVPTTADYTAFSNTTRQGFTGHEQLDAVSLVHMNGRVYDPYLGRFLSADSLIQSLGSSQSVNPYAYAWNDPLRYIDPSGHSLLGVLAGIVAAIIVIWATGGFGAGWYFVTSDCTAIFVSNGVLAGFVGGFVGALVSTGSLSAALTAGVIGAVTAGLFYAAGTEFSGSGAWASTERVLAHAAIGCFNGAVSGGNCGRGAASAALAEAATDCGLARPSSLGTWGSFRGAAEAGVIGGFAARLAGGGFNDGFSIGAAGYLFNSYAHRLETLQLQPGITSDGNTLHGSLAVWMHSGTEDDATEILDRLNSFATANNFDITFHIASFWDKIGFGNVIDVYVSGSAEVAGLGGNGAMYFYGDDFKNYNVVAHEFGHVLGFGDVHYLLAGESEALKSFMYDVAGTNILLNHVERGEVLDWYYHPK